MMRRFCILSAIFVCLLYVAVQRPLLRAVHHADVTGDFGEPIPGLNAFELSLFERGREVFERRFGRAEGLGPHFNASSCRSCHEFPAAGGSSPRYRDFFLVGKTKPDGTISKLFPDCEEKNADEAATSLCLPSLVLPNYGPKGTLAAPVSSSVERPPIPAEADVIARRNAPPLFGVGLFRLVSDKEILSRADPDDADGDGISGRANVISAEDFAIGRFGYKCQTASLEAFNRGALQNQMGITSDSLDFAAAGGAERPGGEGDVLPDFFRIRTAHAQVAEPRDRIVDYDDVPDPEMDRSDLANLIFFQENLAAPRRGRMRPAVTRGEAVFEEIGCAKCHVPSLDTSMGLIFPYTDLLLHDMGPDLGDGIVMEGASGNEFRTQPLWGLCEHEPFLHDGRADTLREAIESHGGEAKAARRAYEALSPADRGDLHRFLESL